MNNRTINRLLILAFLYGCLFTHAQTHQYFPQSRIDSLKRLLSTDDFHQKVDILNQLASIYAPLNFDSAIIYAVQAQRIGTVYGYPEGVGIARLYTGNAYYYKRDFKNALVSYLSAQAILEENQQYNALGELYLMLGHINFFILRGNVAAFYYRKALSNFIKAGNAYSQADALNSLNLTYWRDGPLDSALAYGHKYLNHTRNHHFRFFEASALLNIGMTFIDDSSFIYNEEALKIAKELDDDRLISIIYNNIASNYDRSSPNFNKQGDLKLARQYYNLAFESARNSNYNGLLAMILQSLADISIMEGKYDQATTNLDECEKVLREYSQFPERQPAPITFFAFGKIFEPFIILRTRSLFYRSRFELATKTGNYADALKYQQLYYESGDTLQAVQQGKQLELLLAEAEAERTDQKMRSLAQESELNRLRLTRARFISAGIAAMVVIISLFILMFFQRKKLKAEQKSISMEQRLLRAQMNPHFLFNSLASIQNYIINEDTDKASIYLSRFSQLVRNILDNSVEEFVTLEKEVETIQNYLELQKVRYAGKFEYNIDIDTDIDTEIALIPPMLAQPFIENAIEHGIRHKAGPGHIEIRFLIEDGYIRFEVEDDGVGREKAREIEIAQGRKHRSMATSITVDRLAAINKKLKKKIRLEIIDLKDDKGDGCGTKVRFGIPVGGQIG